MENVNGFTDDKKNGGLTKQDMMSRFLARFKESAIFCLQDKNVVVEDTNRVFGCPNLSLEEVAKFNSEIKKCDMYFAPNGNYATQKYDKTGKGLDCPGRVDPAGKFIHCCAVDIDDGGRTREGIIEPSIIVKTGKEKGYHVYFMLDDPLEYEMYEKDWKELMDKLYVILNADPQCRANRVSGILRLPYTKYWKDNKGEKEIAVEKFDGPVYDWDYFKELIENLYIPLAEKNYADKEYKSIGKFVMDKVTEIDTKIKVGEVLKKISNGKFEAKAGVIREDGKKTDGYKIHPSKNFVFSFSGHEDTRPTGGPFSVVKKYLLDTKKVLRWYHDNYGIEIEDVEERYLEQFNKKVAIDLSKVHVVEDGYIIGKGDSTLKITKNDSGIDTSYMYKNKDGKIATMPFLNGCIEPVGYIYIQGQDNDFAKEKRIIVKITTKFNEEFIILVKPFGGLNDFKKELMMRGLLTLGEARFASKAHNILMNHIYDTQIKYSFTDKLGLQEIDGKRYFVRMGGSYIDGDLFVNITSTQTVYAEPPKRTDQTWKEIVANLMKLYDAKTVYPFFLTIVYGVYVYYWKNSTEQRDLQVPGGFIDGLQGAGKTYLKSLIYKKMLGIPYSMSATATVFAYLYNSIHYITINTEDYRNSAIANSGGLENFLRNVFDGISNQKGTQNQEIKYYPANAQFILDGQTKFSDGATVTRHIGVSTSPAKQGDISVADDIPGCMQNVLELLPDQAAIEKFKALKYELILNYTKKHGKENYHDFNRTCQNYCGLMALGRTMGLSEYENILEECMLYQMRKSEGNDIYTIYTTTLSHFLVIRGGINIIDGGIVIDVNRDASRLQEKQKDDIKSMIKTINNFFGKDEVVLEGLYIDFKFVFENPALRARFKSAVENLYVPPMTKNDPGVVKTLKVLREFMETNFKDSDLIKEINYSLNDFHKKEGTEIEKPF